MFSPAVDEQFEFEGHRYTFPSARPGASYPMEAEGGRATVIRARRCDNSSYWALKVFKPKYRTEKQVEIVRRLEKVSHLPGLEAARQYVVLPQYPAARKERDLEWAVLMPWIAGDTWGKMLGDVVQRRRTYIRPEAEALAVQILMVLTDLERRHIVHCDLSGGNVIVRSRAGTTFEIQLVDLEDMLIEGKAPASTTAGSSGYALPGVRSTACAEGDRYAGAILIAEVLALGLPFDERLVSSEGVFRGNRSSADAHARFTYVCNELKTWKPRFAALAEQAWTAQSLRDCAPLADLLNSLTAGTVTAPAPLPRPALSIDRWGDRKTNVPCSVPHFIAAQSAVTSPAPMPPALPVCPSLPPTVAQLPNLPPVQSRGFGPAIVQQSPPAKSQTSSRPFVPYDAETVALATGLGTPLAGTIIIAMNYVRQGKSREAFLAVVVGFIAAALLIAVGMYSLAVAITLNCVAAACAGTVARALQGSMPAGVQQPAGTVRSRCIGIAVGVVCLIGLIGLLAQLFSKPPDRISQADFPRSETLSLPCEFDSRG